MAKTTDAYIPDSSGTIYVKGHEEEVKQFTLKKIFADGLAKEVSDGKVSMRTLAMEALAKAAEGAMRVCILGKGSAAVSSTVPDYEKEGNRNVISDAVYKKFQKAGGSDSLEIPEEEMFDSTTVTGSKTLVLTGKYYTWFEEQYITSGKIKLDEEEDISVRIVEPSITRRLAFAAIARLKAVSAASPLNSKARKVADILLDGGLKAMSIRVDEGE